MVGHIVESAETRLMRKAHSQTQEMSDYHLTNTTSSSGLVYWKAKCSSPGSRNSGPRDKYLSSSYPQSSTPDFKQYLHLQEDQAGTDAYNKLKKAII